MCLSCACAGVVTLQIALCTRAGALDTQRPGTPVQRHAIRTHAPGHTSLSLGSLRADTFIHGSDARL